MLTFPVGTILRTETEGDSRAGPNKSPDRNLFAARLVLSKGEILNRLSALVVAYSFLWAGKKNTLIFSREVTLSQMLVRG